MALLEIILPTTNPPPFLHLPFLILILALYLCLAYITHAAQGWYTYAFLNPANGAGHVAGYVFGILAATIVIFFLVWVVIWLRRKVTGIGKKSKRDKAEFTSGTRYQDVELTTK